MAVFKKGEFAIVVGARKKEFNFWFPIVTFPLKKMRFSFSFSLLILSRLKNK